MRCKACLEPIEEDNPLEVCPKQDAEHREARLRATAKRTLRSRPEWGVCNG